MSAGRGLGAGLALALLLTAGGASGQKTFRTAGGLEVTDSSVSPAEWTHGCVVHRFEIANPTPVRREVTVSLPGRTYDNSWSAGLGSLSGTVAVEGGSKAVLTLQQPSLGLDGDSSFAVVERGRKRETFPCEASDHQSYSSHGAPSVLLCKTFSAERFEERLAQFAPEGAGSGRTRVRWNGLGEVMTAEHLKSLKTRRLEREPEAWPTAWQAYAGFDSVLLSPELEARLTEEARGALRDYVAAGGMVTFLGVSDVPQGWTEPGGEWSAVPRVAGVRETEYGFGRVQALAAGVDNLASNQAIHLVASWLVQRTPWSNGSGRRSYSFTQCLQQIPVAERLEMPVKRFLLALLVFATVAGPLAVVYAGRRDRRLWLLAIVPALSALFSVGIFASALLSEGVAPRVRRQGVTLLDQTRRRAVTLGAVGVYAPTALAGGLVFDRGTEVEPLRATEFRRLKRIVCGAGQHFTEGWLQPRMASFFCVRRCEERAERLVVTEAGEGAVEVVNALGAPVRRLLLCDGRRVYEAGRLEPGERRGLEVAAGREAPAGNPALQELRKRYLKPSPEWAALTNGAVLPLPGARTYVAELEGCPFVEAPVRGRTVRDTAVALVVGRF